MTSIHPHWQETDDDPERRVRIRSNQPQAKAPQTFAVPRASRRPAAFVGILLFVIAGFAALQGYSLFSNLNGQVSPSSTTVHITATGTNPPSITVQPGTTITWTNDDTIPHILSSDTFPTDDGKPFTTSAIFPGNSTHVLVPVNAKSGTYTYISKTSQAVNGTIVIDTATAAAASSAPAPVPPAQPTTVTQPPVLPQQPTFPSSQQTTTTSTAPNPLAAQAVQPPPDTSTGILPSNPHTVANADTSVTPQQYTTTAPVITTHHPIKAAQTGPEVWVVFFLSIVGLLFITRKSLRLV